MRREFRSTPSDIILWIGDIRTCGAHLLDGLDGVGVHDGEDLLHLVEEQDLLRAVDLRGARTEARVCE